MRVPVDKHLMMADRLALIFGTYQKEVPVLLLDRRRIDRVDTPDALKGHVLAGERGMGLTSALMGYGSGLLWRTRRGILLIEQCLREATEIMDGAWRRHGSDVPAVGDPVGGYAENERWPMFMGQQTNAHLFPGLPPGIGRDDVHGAAMPDKEHRHALTARKKACKQRQIGHWDCCSWRTVNVTEDEKPFTNVTITTGY